MRLEQIFSIRNIQKKEYSKDFFNIDDANQYLEELRLDTRFSKNDEYLSENGFFLFAISPLSQCSINFPYKSKSINKDSTIDEIDMGNGISILVFNYSTENEKFFQMIKDSSGEKKFKKIKIRIVNGHPLFNFYSKKISRKRIEKIIEYDLSEKIINVSTGEKYLSDELRKKFGRYNYNKILEAIENKKDIFGSKWRIGR